MAQGPTFGSTLKRGWFLVKKNPSAQNEIERLK